MAHDAVRSDAQASGLLVIHSGALGDIILLGQFLRLLGERATLVAGGQKGALLQGAGVVERAIDFDILPMHEVFSDRPLQDCQLPHLLGPWGRLISFFAGDDPVARLRLAGLCQADSAVFLPVRPPEEYGGHLVALWGDLLGVETSLDVLTPWQVPSAWRREAAEGLRQVGVDPAKPYAVIHPGSGGVAKCWPLERFIELAWQLGPDSRFLDSRLGGDDTPAVQTLFVLGPAEVERWGAAQVDALGAQFPVLSAPALTTLAAALGGASLYVGNDSGVSHLAAAMGAPTVAVFGASNPAHFAPLGASVHVLAGGDMKAISTARVLAAARALL